MLLYEKINLFLDIVALKTGLETYELIHIWNSRLKIMMRKTKQKVITNKPGPTCIYIYSKGIYRETLCGYPVKKGFEPYCSKHKDFIGKIRKERKIIPSTKHIIDTEERSVLKPDVARIIKENFLIKIHPYLNKFFHKESGLVFHSFNIRQVIGRIVTNVGPFWKSNTEKIRPLVDDDIVLCKKYGFPIWNEC